MMPLLSYLREAGVTPAAKPSHTPLDALLGEYRVWLARERGLAAATVLRYENTARRFLQQQAMAGGDPEVIFCVDLCRHRNYAEGLRCRF